jgi:hypothetical protein
MAGRLPSILQNKSGVTGQRSYTFTGVPQLNTVTLRMEPYGAQRGPAINILDLRLGKRFSLGGTRWFEVDVNVFNALNANTPTAITVASGPAFDYFTSIVPPRVGRIGARLSF